MNCLVSVAKLLLYISTVFFVSLQIPLKEVANEDPDSVVDSARTFGSSAGFIMQKQFARPSQASFKVQARLS
jgi:hypothetical protein